MTVDPRTKHGGRDSTVAAVPVHTEKRAFAQGRQGCVSGVGEVCLGSGACLILATLLITLLLSTLSTSSVHADTPRPRTNLQITLWESGTPGERELLSELVFSFQRANPDIVIALEWHDIDLLDDLVRRWCGRYRDHAPDVTVLPEMMAYDYRDHLIELPSDLRATLRDEFAPSVVRRARGRAGGVPWSVGTPALYYRTDLFEEAGLSVPRTPEELIEAAEVLADPPHCYGLGVPGPGGGGEKLLHTLASAFGPGRRERDDRDDARDGETRDANERDNEEDADEDQDDEDEPDPIVRALELLVAVQARGGLQPEVLTWSESDLVDLFAEGRLAMMIARPQAAGALRRPAQDEDEMEWSTAPLPMTDRGVGQVEVDWLVVFENSGRRENALRFLQYIAEQESQRALTTLPAVPATRALAQEFADRKPWSGHIPALEGGEGVTMSTWERRRGELADAFAWAISGRLTPSEALERARQ